MVLKKKNQSFEPRLFTRWFLIFMLSSVVKQLEDLMFCCLYYLFPTLFNSHISQTFVSTVYFLFCVQRSPMRFPVAKSNL